MKKSMYFLLCLGLITIASCYYDVEAELYGSQVCDNSNVLYTSRIAPLMESKCLSCHDAASGSPVVLDSYNNVKNQFVNGKALCAVEHGSGCLAMPQSGQLSTCDLTACQKWVEAGCPE